MPQLTYELNVGITGRLQSNYPRFWLDRCQSNVLL